MKPYELEILEATAAALSEAEGQTLRRQLELVERAQRWNDDRMVIVGFPDKDAVPRLAPDATDHCLGTVRLKTGSRTITARVMTHRGILSSLEFRPSPRELEDRSFTLEVTDRDGAEPLLSDLIDDEEHQG